MIPQLLAGTAMVVTGFGAQGASFKAEHYPTCYGLVTEARGMVAKPPVDVAGTASKAGEVAGTIGKLGGLGIPGLGALGGLASKASTVATYSNYLGDAAKFTKKMQDDYPDAPTRVAAYGDKMGGDADKIGGAGLKLDEARGCYDKSFTELKAGVTSGEINGKDAAKRQKEIVAGLDLANEVLSDARTTMDTNIKSYNEAITSDTTGMGLNLGSIAQAASLGTAAVQMSNAGAANNMYSAYYTQTNAYTSAWWDAHNRGADPNAAAMATLNGAKAPVQPYQEAYWKAQAAAAAKGTALSAVPQSSIANLGTLQSLTQLGGLGGLSGTGLAWVAANQAVGAVGSAVNGAAAPQGQAVVPEATAAASTAADIGSIASKVNVLRGASGGGAAFLAGNMAVGMLGDGLRGKSDAERAAATAASAEVSDAMKASLLKTSVDSGKFTDAYGMVNLQTQEYAALSEVVKAKLE